MTEVVQTDRLDAVAVQTSGVACVVKRAQRVATRLRLPLPCHEDERRCAHESKIDFALTRAVRAQLALKRGQQRHERGR